MITLTLKRLAQIKDQLGDPARSKHPEVRIAVYQQAPQPAEWVAFQLWQGEEGLVWVIKDPIIVIL